MQDGIVAGNGNSRYLKTVAEALSLYPTYQDFIAALIAGTFPIDLNGINAAGWVQQGTALNKANLLADVTASSIGLGGNATPNDAFAKIKQLIDAVNANVNNRKRIKIVSYIGTGTYGEANPCHIVSDFPIGMALYMGYKETDNPIAMIYNASAKAPPISSVLLLTDFLTISYVYGSGFWEESNLSAYGKKSANNTEIWWYATNGVQVQLNLNTRQYFFLLIEK